MTADPKPESQPICILGMHRSGTSALTRVLGLAGVELGGDSEVAEIGPDNPKGYWEHPGFRQINEELLTRLDGGWANPPFFDPAGSGFPEHPDLEARAKELVSNVFGDKGYWAWKDPRTSLTLPFWQRFLAPKYVICVRNPLAVAESIHTRNHLNVEDALQLWFEYMISALAHSSGAPRVIVHYEHLMTDWAPQLDRILSGLGLVGLQGPESIRESVEAFLVPGLQHHRFQMDDLLSSPRVEYRCASLYAALCSEALCSEAVGSDDVERDSNRIDKLAAIALSELASVARQPVEESGDLSLALVRSRRRERGLAAGLTAYKRRMRGAMERLATECWQADRDLRQLTSQTLEDRKLAQKARQAKDASANLQEAVARLDAEAAGMRSELAAARPELDALRAQVAQQTASHDARVKALKAALHAKEAELVELQRRLAELEEIVEGARREVAYLQSSRLLRMAKSVDRVKGWALGAGPRNGHREAPDAEGRQPSAD